MRKAESILPLSLSLSLSLSLPFSLPPSNTHRCHLFLANLAESVTELGYKVDWSLPLVNPLPFHIAAVVFIELQPLTHLIVSINEGLVDQYHLIKLMTVSSQPSFQQQTPVSTPGESPPKSFLAIQNLIELDPEEICFEHLKSVLCMFVCVCA